jgi:non-heme chloroperoxidase
MLIFVHGICNIPETWNPLIQYLTGKNYSCKAIDVQEGLDLRKTHIYDYVKKVKRITNEDDILIGHSLGGLIVQKAAEETRVKAIIAICSVPPKKIRSKMIVRMFYPSLKYVPKVLMNRPFKPDFSYTKKFVFTGLSDEELEQAKKQYKKFRKESALVIREIVMQTVKIDEQKINCPMLFIAAKHDGFFPPEIIKRIAEKYNAEYKIYDCCHNFFSHNNWIKVADGIHEFISNIQ